MKICSLCSCFYDVRMWFSIESTYPRVLKKLSNFFSSHDTFTILVIIMEYLVSLHIVYCFKPT